MASVPEDDSDIKQIIISDSSESEDQGSLGNSDSKVDTLAEELSLLKSPTKKKSRFSHCVEVDEEKYKDISSSSDEDPDFGRKSQPSVDAAGMFGGCPVYFRGKTEKYSFEDVLKIILADHPKENLCAKQPMRCRKDMSFLIDTSRVKVQDLPFDDNGSYVGSGSHTWTYKVVGTDPNDVAFQSRKREEPEERSTQYVYLRRNYRTNKASSDFRQVVSYLEDANGNIVNNTALLQYNFKGKEHFFEAKPHGNRKSSSGPFLPTNKTTKEEIRETAGKSKPQKAILKLMKSKDLLSANSSAETPRDRKQVYNFKRSERLKTTNQQGKKDEIYAVMLQAAAEEEEGEEPFVHSIASWPEPMYILGFQYQFHDIARFCSDPSNHCLLTIDTTFNLGNFYVTPTSYRNLLLETTRTGKNPLFLGPTLVHMTRSYAAYSHLLAKLKEVEPNIDDVKATINDGEPGLMKALDTFLRNSIKLRCLGHFRQNVKEKLKKLGIRGAQETYSLDKVFGSVCGDVRVEGLLDASNEEEFDSLLLASKREIMEKESELNPDAEPSFYSWVEQHATLMKKSMILGVRSAAGLSRDDSCTSNDAESNNHVLKSAADNEQMSTVEFISLSKSLALNQRQEVIRALLKCGEYRLKEAYSNLQVTGDRWYQMSKEHKMRHLKKVMETPVTQNKEGTDHPLSISYTSARLAKPPTMLAAIWAKAQEHLLTPGSISVLPSDDDTGSAQTVRRAKRFAVYSRSNPDFPNVVKLYDDGSIECPCPMFKSSKNVCSHSVAVAEREDVLAITLDWVRNSESDCNLYNLATMNINVRASGQKGGKERRTRKTQKKATPAYTITNKEQLALARLGSWEPTSLPQVTRPSAPIPFSSQTRTSSNPTLIVQSEAASIGLGLGQAMEQRATSAAMSQYHSTANLSVTVSNEEQQESAALGGWQPAGLAQAMVQPIPTLLPSQNAVVPSSCHGMYFQTYPTVAQPAVQPHQPNAFLQSINRYVPWHNDNPFIIMNINGRIKKCAGCRREFSDPFGPVFVGIVVRHSERDYYNDKNGFRRIGNEQARYYHPEKACLMARHQHFTSSMLQLHPDLALDGFQASHLNQQLSIEVSPAV